MKRSQLRKQNQRINFLKKLYCDTATLICLVNDCGYFLTIAMRKRGWQKANMFIMGPFPEKTQPQNFQDMQFHTSTLPSVYLNIKIV